jgi:hypothetical protein
MKRYRTEFKLEVVQSLLASDWRHMVSHRPAVAAITCAHS